jgi:hypothetical protein
VYTEAFEDGLAGWEKDAEIVFAGGSSLPWQADSTAPGDHPGGVARGVGTAEGDCSGGPGDYSSRDSITSPVVTLPAGSQSPRMRFDHYIATEAGFDGGNVKMSVNQGGFELIPTSAYTFNKPNATLRAAPPDGDNTSPLAGQDGFTGTDGGEVSGSWGQSQIDLGGLNVKAGDQLRFRFDMGRDGCGGLDGWYVDDVTVEICTATATPPAPPSPPAPGAPIASETVLKIKPKSLNYKEDFKAKIKVRTEGERAQGIVRLFTDGKKIGKGILKDGQIRLILEIEKNLKPGKVKFVAKYKGSKKVLASKDKKKKNIQRALERENE